ncbi:hypothetical protein NUSPORA_00869 [Nucleospora cyclopteri]
MFNKLKLVLVFIFVTTIVADEEDGESFDPKVDENQENNFFKWSGIGMGCTAVIGLFVLAITVLRGT